MFTFRMIICNNQYFPRKFAAFERRLNVVLVDRKACAAALT